MTVSEDLIEYRKQLAQVYCMNLKGISPLALNPWSKTSTLESLEDAMKELQGFWENDMASTFKFYLSDDELSEYFE